MQIGTDISHGRGRISLAGRFDFNSHRDFRKVCDQLLEDAAVQEIEVNCAHVEYLDSSALGMLLLLREKSESLGKRVALSGLQGTVKQVLDIANFGKLFTIRE